MELSFGKYVYRFNDWAAIVFISVAYCLYAAISACDYRTALAIAGWIGVYFFIIPIACYFDDMRYQEGGVEGLQ